MVAAVLKEGLVEIADTYDLFLVDQWGVLHNGGVAKPAAMAALAAMRATGRPVVLLSNSAKRAAVSVANLRRMGIGPWLYDHIVTSGELGWQALHDRSDLWFAALGRRCLMFTWGGDRQILEGLDLAEADSVAGADFLLNAGTDGAPVAFYEPVMADAAERGLPMLCLNPDLVTVTPEGGLVVCPGSLAKRYEELGGSVRYIGKPHPEVYAHALALAPDASRPLAIGDSLHHDILGAQRMGLDSVLVAGGVHAPDLRILPGMTPAAEALDALYAREGIAPTYAMAELLWRPLPRENR